MSKYTKPNQNNQGQGENSALSAIRAYREGAQGKTGLQAISEYRAGLAQSKSTAGVQKQTASGLDAIRAYREKITPLSASKPVQDQQVQQPQQKIYYGEDTISQWYDDSPNGVLYSQMFEYSEEHRNKMADMQVQRLQQKMQAAEKEVASAEARADAMLKRSEELSVVAGNIERLKQEYEQTGDEVKLQAYLIASENYNQKVQAYNADLQKLQKDEKVYDTYNQAYVNYERARMMQEQRMAAQAERDEQLRVAKMEQIRKLMKEDPAAGLVLAEADGRQISRTLDELEDEKSALIRTGKAVDWDAVDAINEKIKGVAALQEQLLRNEANSKGWNSTGGEFAERSFDAIAAGGHSGLAGLAAAVDTVFNPVEYLVGTTLGNVADMLGSEDLKKTAEAWTQASKKYENAEPLRGQAQYYADQATARAGKVDGWILNNLQSVGGMMFDAATMGMASAAGGAAGLTTGKVMAVRAAGNGMLDAAEKGYSGTEQILLGVATGALEYVSEKMFGGNPIYDADGGFVTNALAKVIQNPKILRLMYSKGFGIAAEGLEEVFVEFLQPVAEGMITSTDIEWASATDLASAMAGGMFISLTGAGAQVMVTEISGAGKAQRQAVKDAGAMIQNADAVQDLILEGLEAKKGTEAYELAAKMQNKLDSGEAISTMEIGRLLMANQEAIEAGYLTEDTKVEPDAKAPKNALADPEQGFYAIRIRKTEDGKNGYRMVHVKPDGSIDVFGEQTNDLFAAKTAAEIKGYNIRHIGTEQQLYEAAIEEEAEYVKNHTYEEEQTVAEAEISEEEMPEQTYKEDQSSMGQVNAAETENTAQTGGIDWAGNDYGKGVETNGRNETAVDRRAQGVETAAQRLGQSGNAARNGGYPAGSENQRKARRTEAVSRRREEANRIRTYAADHGIPLRSAKDIGLGTGSDIKNLRVLPKGFDKNVDETVELIENAGLRAVVVSGPIQMVIAGEEQYMNGVLYNGVVYVQADSISAMPQQIAKHEVFHKKAAEDPELIDRMWDFARNHYDGNEIRKRFNQYYEAYKDVYTDADPDTLRHLIQEELLADAYAEYERYGEETLPGLTEEAWEQAWKSEKTGSGTGMRFSVASEDDAMYKNHSATNQQEEVRFSMERNDELMELAVEKNKETECAAEKDLEEAKRTRQKIADRMKKIKADERVALPEDVEGNTYIANSSYDGTEENTTICPRSLAAEAFVDAVSEYLGRPLTFQEQIYISQDLQGRTLTPECLYCYVATDRKAYRVFLGEWVKQRDAVLEKLKENPDADTSRKGALYNEFRNGRKDTDHMYGRFKMWVDAYKSGAPMVEASHLANINKLMGDIESEFGAELKPQIVDAMKYAQAASWAKKRVSYVAYNGHILKWKQNRINKLNGHYGLRMYSFSDFHPAFVLENMQMITDASVRGLKMLGYTKDIDFVKIFAPTGMNINVSVFGFAYNGNVYENALQGASWEEAQKMREQYPNVGVTFVATNDEAIRWALAQEWIDVVIPYHLVRTGEEVAKALNYTNYTGESSDTKTKEWKKGDAKYIAPTVHNNDKEKYLEALEKNHLKPRFARFLYDPNYMKLVNECRRPASESEAVRPVFDEKAALAALDKLERDGYYQPIGGSVDRMYEIASEVGDKIYNAEKTGTALKFSVASEDKARERAEKKIANGIGRIMYMPNSAVKKLQTGMIRELLTEYQQTGEIDADKLSDAVATAFAEGLVANNEFYETYKPVKDYLRSTPVMISEADQSSIADYNQFRKKAFGTLRIVREGGLPVDVMYQEVQEMAPGLLKPVMMHPADQLVQLYEKAKEIRKVEVPLERAMGEQADQFYEWAEGQILKLLEKELIKYADSVQWKREGTETAMTQGYEWENTYDRANERMYDYGQQSYYELPEPGSGIVQEDYIYPEEGGLEWAGQLRTGNWLRDQERKRPEGRFDERTVESEEETGQFVVDEFVPEPVVEEELTEEEKARRGTMREWIQYVMRDGVPPEEFAERMRRSAVGELKGDAKIIADRMEETARQKRGDRENLYRDPELTDEEYEKLNAAWKVHQEQKAGAKQRETVVRKKDFESTPAMDKLGIKIDGSVTRYRATDMLRGYEKAARDAERMLDKRLKKMHASQEEIMFGKMLADGIMDVNSLNYRAINIERIAEIADYYMAKKSFDDDRLYQRKAEINQANDQIAKDLLTDREAFQPHLSGKLQPFTKMIMNERTPERVIKQIFGAEQGEKIFEFYFRPVWVNGNEMIRFKNRMLRRAQGYTDDKDTVGGFYDQDGKRRQLTEAEWGMAQRLLEGKAVAEEYEKLREDEKSKIAKAARALNDDMSLEEVSEKYQLTEGYQQGLAQAYADYLELNEVADEMDRVIMENAVKTYQQIYNEFYDAYNDFLVSHGMEEIGFIKNYAPHFQKQEVQHGLRAAMRSMGVTNDKVTELPSEIAGRTADFKPSKKWNPHSLERKGSQTDYHLLQGFQQYLDYAAEVFYHTDDVMRLRSAVKFLRGQYAAKEISAEIEGAFADMYKPVEWKTKRLRDVGVLKPDGIYTEREVNAAFEAYTAQLLEKASPESLVKWSEFTTWMENAANVIAGKQSVADRGTEFGGRLLLNIGNKLTYAFAKANVAGNLSSVLNQTAQVPLLQVELGKYLEMAVVDIAKGGVDADFVDHSDLLTEKKGVDMLTTDNVEKFVMALFKPVQMMDGLVSKLAVRGRFLKALDEGMTDEEAMKVADDFARRIMGSRMKGMRPQGFESKNWIARMIHIFQLENANVFDYMLLSDMPQAVQHVAKTKGKKAAQRYVATTAAYYLMSAAALNAIVGSISGGSPASFDIIGWLLTFVAGGWGRGDEEFLKTVIDNGTEKLFGERVFDTKRLNKERGFDWAGAVENAGYDVVNDIPFVSNIAGVMGWGDQTMPTVGINEMAEDLWSGVTTIFNQITGGEEKTGLDWAGAVGKSASDILNALSQAVPGGRQAKKTVQAARALILGGRYSGFGKNKKLMYTVDRGIASAAQGLMFGPSAWEETDNYYAGGKSLTAAQTQKAKTLKKHGVDVEDTYELYQDFAEINEELNAERISSIEAKQQKRNLIAAMDLTDEQKMIVYMQTLASGDEKSKEKAEAKYTALLQDGVSWAQITDLENEFAFFGEDADGDGERDMDSVDYGIARRNAIAAMDLNDWQRLEVFDQYMLDKNSNSYESTRAELETMLDEGLTWDDVTDAHNTYAMINADDTMNATQKATAYAKWADEQGWTDAQIEAAKDRYMFWQMIPAEATSYEKFAGAGLSSDNAAKVVEVLSNLEPEAGKKSVSDVQRIEAIADGGFSAEDAKSAIRAILSETQTETFDDLMKSGLTPAQYAQYRRSVYGLEADKDKNGNAISGSKKKKVLNAINKLPISKALKTELYFASGYGENTLDDAPWM